MSDPTQVPVPAPAAADLAPGASPDAARIPGLSARLSKWFSDSEVILLAWLSGIPVVVVTFGSEFANMLGVPEIKTQVDAIISGHPNAAKIYGIAVPMLFYWARKRRSSKDPV